jgi:iron(III) transport system permease protein
MNVFNLSSPPFDIYSMAGMIWVDGLHYSPMAFLLMTARSGRWTVAGGVGDDERSQRVPGALEHHPEAHLAGDLRDLPDPLRRAIESFEVRRCSGCRSASGLHLVDLPGGAPLPEPDRPGLDLRDHPAADHDVGIYFISKLSSSGSKYSTMTGKGFRPAPDRSRPLALGRGRGVLPLFPADRAAAVRGAALVVVPEVLLGAFDRGAEEPDARPVSLRHQLPEPRPLVWNSVALSFGSAT